MTAGSFSDIFTYCSVKGKYADGDINILINVSCLRTVAGHNCASYPLEKPSSLSVACDTLRDGIRNLSRNSYKNLIST